MTSPPHGAPTAHRRVAVGFNGTDHSRVALRWAADEAVRCDAPLLVLFAANYPGMAVDPLEPGALTADEEVTALGVAEAEAAHPGLRVEASTVATSPTQALAEAGAWVSMVVLGTRGYGRVRSVLLGSVAFTVAARAPSPVVVVKEHDDPGRRHRVVVVGTDGSPQGEAAVDFAAARAQMTDCSLVVLSCTGEHGVVHVDPASLRRRAAAIGEAAAARVAQVHPGLDVTARAPDAAPDQSLVEASAAAELVVVGTRGRGAFAGLMLGSVSHAVIHGAHCPVAVV